MKKKIVKKKRSKNANLVDLTKNMSGHETHEIDMTWRRVVITYDS